MRTWERYFFKKWIGSALLFLAVFYGLYILIDYASHLSSANYHHSKLKVGEFFIHYLAEFSLKADLLIPFALLIATVHTLTQLNVYSELVSLLASGHSLHRLMRPFLIGGLFAVGLLYINNEWIVPAAAKERQSMDKKYKIRKQKELLEVSAHALLLDDGSHLIYKEFDPSLKKFFEAYWIVSIDEMWRMEELDPFQDNPTGNWIDHFIRNSQGVMEIAASYPEKEIPSLSFNEKALQEILLEPQDLSLSELWDDAPNEQTAEENEKAARFLTALYRKLVLPWLALIAVIAPAPFCLKFGRSLPIFLIFAGAIFGHCPITRG